MMNERLVPIAKALSAETIYFEDEEAYMSSGIGAAWLPHDMGTSLKPFGVRRKALEPIPSSWDASLSGKKLKLTSNGTIVRLPVVEFDGFDPGPSPDDMSAETTKAEVVKWLTWVDAALDEQAAARGGGVRGIVITDDGLAWAGSGHYNRMARSETTVNAVIPKEIVAILSMCEDDATVVFSEWHTFIYSAEFTVKLANLVYTNPQTIPQAIMGLIGDLSSSSTKFRLKDGIQDTLTLIGKLSSPSSAGFVSVELDIRDDTMAISHFETVKSVIAIEKEGDDTTRVFNLKYSELVVQEGGTVYMNVAGRGLTVFRADESEGEPERFAMMMPLQLKDAEPDDEDGDE